METTREKEAIEEEGTMATFKNDQTQECLIRQLSQAAMPVVINELDLLVVHSLSKAQWKSSLCILRNYSSCSFHVSVTCN